MNFVGKSQIVIAAVAICALTGLTGCSQGGGTSSEDISVMHGSRAQLYGSVRDLAGDSSLAIVGTIGAQKVAKDIDDQTPFTISTVNVIKTVKTPAFGSKLKGGGAETKTEVMEVEVRQLGTSAMSEVPAAILKQGSTYLLFLTPSMLGGDLAHQYYVTGGDAGIYIGPSQALSTGKVPTTRFTQAVAVKGEALPAALNTSELEGLR